MEIGDGGGTETKQPGSTEGFSSITRGLKQCRAHAITIEIVFSVSCKVENWYICSGVSDGFVIHLRCAYIWNGLIDASSDFYALQLML